MHVEKLGSFDPSSYSNPDQVIITHIALSLVANFTTHKLSGSEVLTCTVKEDGVNVLILDVRDVAVSKVVLLGTDTPLSYSISDPYKTFGSALKINIPRDLKSSTIIKLKIFFETSPSASGLQWLTPAQTLGKQEPFMFSQFQAIHARSVYPCQDTPGVKFQYSAEVAAPEALTVLMSGLHVGEPTATDGIKTSKFQQLVPIPSYLVAFAIGRLASKKLGPRCSVWSEPEALEKSAFEFAEMEQMLDVAIDLAGEYVWKVCDLLVMPPSFPFGGMENPNIIFVTPTVLAGDRSLAEVVAHEISHSWSGNLVTTRTFEHFWLNEGFTMFMERKILSRLHGPDVRLFHAAQGFEDLKDTVENTFGSNHLFTKLVPDLTDADPDDAFSTVPYEKGHSFLYFLEERVGGQDIFNPFLKYYFSKFQNQSITTNDFKTAFLEYFKENPAVSGIDWDTWLYSTGMPAVIPSYKNALTVACSELAEAWRNGLVGRGAEDIKSLSSNQISYTLELLLEGTSLSADTIRRMTLLYNLSEYKNSEIRFRWLRLGLRAHAPEFVENALTFVNEQGRMKFVRPIYRDLYDWEQVRQQAIENYHKNKQAMMFVLANQLLKDLHIQM